MDGLESPLTPQDDLFAQLTEMHRPAKLSQRDGTIQEGIGKSEIGVIGAVPDEDIVTLIIREEGLENIALRF